MEQEALVDKRARQSEFVSFWQAGTNVKGEFHCAECSYGVIVTRDRCASSARTWSIRNSRVFTSA